MVGFADRIQIAEVQQMKFFADRIQIADFTTDTILR